MQRKNDGLYKKSAVGVVDNNGLEPLTRPTASGFPLDKNKNPNHKARVLGDGGQ